MHYIFKYFKTAFYAFNKCDTFMYLINNNEKNMLLGNIFPTW